MEAEVTGGCTLHKSRDAVCLQATCALQHTYRLVAVVLASCIVHVWLQPCTFGFLRGIQKHLTRYGAVPLDIHAGRAASTTALQACQQHKQLR
jgi:hypothetical protein